MSRRFYKREDDMRSITPFHPYRNFYDRNRKLEQSVLEQN